MFAKAVFCAFFIQLVFCGLTTSAQTSPEVIRFQSPGFDTARQTVKDAAGNIYIAASIPRSNQQTSFAVLKYNAAGNFVWAAHYNGSQGGFNGEANSVSVDSAGNVFATGYVQPESVTQIRDFLVVKFDSSGVEQWAHRVLNGSGIKIIADPAGNVYATGTVTSETWDDDWLTIKYAADGTRLWERSFDSISTGEQSATQDFPFNMALDSGNNLIVTGISNPLSAGFPGNMSTIKYDPNGNVVFQATYNETDEGDEIPFDIEVEANGDIWITGLTQADPYARQVPVLLKYDAQGQLLLALGNQTAGGRAIDVDSAGNVFVSGQAGVARYQNSGAKVWERPLTFPAYRLLTDSGGNIYVSGSHPRFGATAGDYMTVKFDASGNQIFAHAYNGLGNGHDEVSDILLDNSENLYVVGTSRIDSQSFEDIVTLKFLSGINPPVQLPGAPTRLTAVATSTTTVLVRWQDNSFNEDGFRIERCQGTSCTNFVQIAQVGANVTSFTDTGLRKNTLYSYRVRAFNAAGVTAYSNVYTARTPHR